MDFKIRKLKIEDLESILDLNKSLFEFEKTFTDNYKVDWAHSKNGRNYFIRVCSWTDTCFGFVAEVEGANVGYLACRTYDSPYRTFNQTGEIENMFISENYRGNGLGRRLIESALKEFKARKIKLVKIGALFENEDAIEVYKALGFKEHELFLEKELN